MSNYFKAVFAFNRPLEEKIPEERNIHAKMSASPLFATPPVAYIDLLAAIDAQDLAQQQAQQGGTELTAAMRNKEKIVDDMIRQLKPYVTMVADGDTEIILSSGFRHTKPRENGIPMAKVETVEGGSNGITGELKLRWKPVKNKQFYEVEYRPNLDGKLPEEVTEEGWESIATTPANIILKGLKPLTYYEVRVRAKGKSGYGAYSDVVLKLVT